MSPQFLLDTNVVSESLRPRPDRGLLAMLRQHQGDLAIAAPVWHELWFGCYRLPLSDKRAKIESFLNDIVSVTVPILPYDENAATWHAVERARLAAIGKTPAFVDGQIAAVAVTNDLALVTFNTAHYRVFASLSVIDWAS